MRKLGAPAGAIPADRSGAPCWPPGIVGSITHKGSYRAAAVARVERLAGLGIDAETDAALPPGVLETIASAHEVEEVARLLAGRAGIAWDRLLFSAKEAVVKAAHPLRVDAAGVRTVEITLDADGLYGATLAASGGEQSLRLRGSWAAGGGLLVTAAGVKGPPGDST